MKLIILIILFLITNLNSATIKGYVYSADNEPLAEANITIDNTTLGAATDANGFYYINNIPEGNYSLLCQYIGFYPRRTIEIKLAKDDVYDLDFLLFPRVYELKKVTLESNQDKSEIYTFNFRSIQKVNKPGQIILQDFTYKKPECDLSITFWEKLRWRIWKIFND